MSVPTEGRPAIRKRATMRDVAALAGVGLKTVSRVINSEPNVSPSTIDKVNAAVAQLDFRPDIHAGNLKRTDRKTRTLGLVVGSVANPFSGALHRGVEDEAHERGTAVFASSLDDDASRETRIVSEMLRRRVDGLILTTVRKNQSYLAPEQQRGTVLAFVDREPSGIDADSIVTNNAGATSAATQSLLQLGHRKLAFLGDRAELWTASERRRGFLESLAAGGIAIKETPVIQELHDEDLAFEAVMALLTGPERPTALFTSQNLVTIGAVRALRKLGLHHEIALFGFDDIPLGDMIDPGISVVSQNPYEMGRRAAQRVFSRLEGDESETATIEVPSVLIHRGSGEIRP